MVRYFIIYCWCNNVVLFLSMFSLQQGIINTQKIIRCNLRLRLNLLTNFHFYFMDWTFLKSYVKADKIKPSSVKIQRLICTSDYCLTYIQPNYSFKPTSDFIDRKHFLPDNKYHMAWKIPTVATEIGRICNYNGK